MAIIKRTILLLLIILTSLLITYQIYVIFCPKKINSNEKIFLTLVDQYEIVKMQRLVLEEQYALAKTKDKVLRLANLVKNNDSKYLEDNSSHIREHLLPSRIHSFRLTSNTLNEQNIGLSVAEANTFRQLEAYVNNNKPIQAKPMTVDEKHLIEANPDDFTLQLMGVRDINELLRYVNDNKLPEAHVFHTYYLNKDWYVLVSGRYKNHTEALKALESLPTTIRELKPWIRQLSTIQKAIQQYR